MKHLKKFNENNELPEGMQVGGLKCDNPNCDWNDMSVPFSDYESSINKPCPECGESLLSQEEYDEIIQIKQAIELLNTYSEEEINNMVKNLSEDEIDAALDKMNQLKMKKKGEDEEGREIWSIGESKKLKNLKRFNENQDIENNELLDSKLDEVYEILKEEIKSSDIEDFYEAEEMIEKSVMRYLGDKLWNDEDLIDWMKKKEFGE